MNLVISFVILLCLAGSEFSNSNPADDLPLRLACIAIIAALVPGLAFVQTTLIARGLRSQDADNAGFERLCNRVNSCHLAVWLAASIAIIYLFRWHDVVRHNWFLDRFVLVDELLILAPIIFSLVASWFVFSQLPQAWEQRKQKYKVASANTANRHRWNFVWLRIRLYLLVIALPVCVVVTISDLTPTLARLSPSALATIAIAFTASLALATQLLASLPWNAHEATEATRLAFQIETANDRRPPNLRIWNTGNQIVNASAVGMLPWLKQIWISDRLQKLFPSPELQAIIRHELAHLRHRHVAIRTLLLLLPLAVWSGLGWLLHDDLTLVDPIAAYCEISPFAASLCLSFLYGIYSLAILRIVSHAFEYQADLIASCRIHDRRNYRVCPERLKATRTALERLAICMPGNANKETIFHPSLFARINRLDWYLDRKQQVNAEASIRRTLRNLAFAAFAIFLTLTSIILLIPA